MYSQELVMVVCLVFVHTLLVVMVNAQFTVQPVSVVQAEGLEAVFVCHYPGALVHSWRIDGELLAADQFLPNVTRISPSPDSPTARLIIVATPQYNNTVVQCEAIVREGEGLVEKQSDNATLTVQDLRKPVLQITQDAIFIFWENPFTNIIIFRLVARSVESNKTIVSVYVNDTRYTFTSLDSDLCEDILFTVTPIDGMGNGTTSEPAVGYFPRRRDVFTTRCQGTEIPLETQCDLISSTPLTCEVELTFSSNDANELPHIAHTVTINGDGGTTYSLNSTIVANRRYLVDLKITTPSGRHALPSQIVSTHDIIKARVGPSVTEGALRTSCTFVPDTTATGYLTTVSRESCSDTVFSAKYDTAGTGDIISGIGSGRYTVTFFDIENDGLPTHSRDSYILIASASLVEITITSGTRSQNPIESGNLLDEANIEMNNNTACVYCSPVKNCLVLLYDCTTPDLLITLFVPASEERCLSLQNKRYSVAFYGIDNSQEFLLDNFPGKVYVFDRDLTTNPVTTVDSPTTTSASSSVFSISLYCYVLLTSLHMGCSDLIV